MRTDRLARILLTATIAMGASAMGASAMGLSAPPAAATAGAGLTGARLDEGAGLTGEEGEQVNAGQSRWVAVAVVTLWAAPESPRPVDAPALTNPVDVPTWLANMTLAQRLGLNGRVDTQAVYGSPLSVLETKGSWTKVVVLNQPSPRNALGYPGWLPTVQLTEKAPTQGDWRAVVVKPTAKVYTNAARTRYALTLSYGTNLMSTKSSKPSGSTSLAVKGLGGVTWYIDPTAVEIYSGTAARPAPTGTKLVAEARKFLGLDYLWGGTSGWGFDCSGLVEAAYSRFGVIIPRDATPQYNAPSAKKITRKALKTGDLVFFATSSGSIHHVGMYVGSGEFIHSPRTGRKVEISSLDAQPWAREFAGGRRYVS